MTSVRIDEKTGCLIMDLVAFQPTYRHVKTGGLYQVLFDAFLERDVSHVVVYMAADGTIWVRPWEEFHDGRFVAIEDREVKTPTGEAAAAAPVAGGVGDRGN